MRQGLSREERILGMVIAAVIVVVFTVGLLFEYTWWRGASIVTAVVGMAAIFIAFRVHGRRIRAEESKPRPMGGGMGEE